jgi:uncharacterized protein (DUF2267 family)
MPVPPEYQHASEDFAKFLLDARKASGLTTTHQAYTMVQGVLQVFRRRLTVLQAISFAAALPPVLRALFVADWDPTEPQRRFEDRAAMTTEMKSLRAAHNFAPDTAIRDVAVALRKNVRESDFDAVLAKLPQDARDYWRV